VILDRQQEAENKKSTDLPMWKMLIPGGPAADVGMSAGHGSEPRGHAWKLGRVPGDRFAQKSSWRLKQFRQLHQLHIHHDSSSRNSSVVRHGQVTEATKVNTHETNTANKLHTPTPPTITPRTAHCRVVITQTRGHTERKLAESLVRKTEDLRFAKVVG
jgi:hypothetical protein